MSPTESIDAPHAGGRKMPGDNPAVVVLAPDVLGRGFSDPACARLLTAWRDGRIMPALDRSLLRLYLKVLRNLGVEPLLLRRWGWWLTARDRVRFLEIEREAAEHGGRRRCVEVAKMAGAVCVISCSLSEPAAQGEAEDGVPWRRPEAFLESLL